jgi:uncharacterized Ntn-hydrolase superfamily protein
MTFTVMARCGNTGEMGMCTSSFSPIAGSRVPSLRPGRGVLVVMAFAAPAMVSLGGRLLDEGTSAPEVLKALQLNDPYPQHRQIGILDASGGLAANTGTAAVPYAEHRCGEGFIVLGNVVASEAVISAMYEGFVESEGSPLAERLLRGIECGRDAGGQLDGQRSAFIKVLRPHEEVPGLDLRVDYSPEPIGKLRGIYEQWLLRPGTDGRSAVDTLVGSPSVASR